MDVDAEMQLFDLKTKYQFQTSPGVDQYNMPLYDFQSETPGSPNSPDIGLYPVYQGFVSPAYINGVQVQLQTQKNSFFNMFPNIVQDLQVVAVGNGGTTYTVQLTILGNTTPVNIPVQAILRGHIDITGIIKLGTNIDPPIQTSGSAAGAIASVPTTSVFPAVYFTSIDATGANVIVSDSGQFLDTNVNYGLLMKPGRAPDGNTALTGVYSTSLNTINYLTGQATFNFPVAIPSGVNINAQCYYFQTGLPRAMLYYNNTLTLRNPPDRQYLVEIDAYLSPAAFFSTDNALPFGYMAEYIARGAARKILLDTGDVDQFQFYEPEFNRQRNLVWKRSQRQWTNNRTETIYSQGSGHYGYGNNNGAVL